MMFFIRVDSSDIIGTGHIFRTLALAYKLKSLKHEVIYLCRNLPVPIKERIENDGFRIISIPESQIFEAEIKFVVTAITTQKPDWIIVDHCEVKESYYNILRQTGIRILAIDDINHTVFPVDILLNQNIAATKYRYQGLSQTRQLLGPQYAL